MGVLHFCTSFVDENIVALLKSLTHLWGLDVEMIIPLSLLSNTGVPWVLVDPGGIFHVDNGMEDEESLLYSFLSPASVRPVCLSIPGGVLQNMKTPIGFIDAQSSLRKAVRNKLFTWAFSI
nr:hypothetical protein [Tanacetum cinerariifolium]